MQHQWSPASIDHLPLEDLRQVVGAILEHLGLELEEYSNRDGIKYRIIKLEEYSDCVKKCDPPSEPNK